MKEKRERIKTVKGKEGQRREGERKKQGDRDEKKDIEM